MHQECGAAVGSGAQQVDAALGLLPILDHDVFQLVVQKFLGGAFVSRVDFDEIGQHAQRLEAVGRFRAAPNRRFTDSVV